MAELTADQVLALAESVGLSMTGGDLAEVTHRLNAFLDALAPLRDLPIEDVQPVPLPLDYSAPGAGNRT